MGANKEKWKAVKGYKGFYEVSDIGRIRSVDRIIKYADTVSQLKRGRLMNPVKNTKTGYWQVMLCRDGKRRLYAVHRLVAEAFLTNPFDYEEVRFRDGNKDNCAAQNLMWWSANRVSNIIRKTDKA